MYGRQHEMFFVSPIDKNFSKIIPFLALAFFSGKRQAVFEILWSVIDLSGVRVDASAAPATKSITTSAQYFTWSSGNRNSI
jgi:hypothetical protein